MNIEYNYKVTVCPFCKQGFVEIVKEVGTNELFLCCDECEIEWSTPNEVLIGAKGTRNKYGKITEPTFDEISEKGWDKYVLIQ